MAVYEKGSSNLPDIKSTSALILDFQAFRIVRNTFPLFIHFPVYYILLQQPEWTDSLFFLSTIESRVLKPPTFTVELFISPFNSVNIFSHIWSFDI